MYYNQKCCHGIAIDIRSYAPEPWYKLVTHLSSVSTLLTPSRACGLSGVSNIETCTPIHNILSTSRYIIQNYILSFSIINFSVMNIQNPSWFNVLWQIHRLLCQYLKALFWWCLNTHDILQEVHTHESFRHLADLQNFKKQIPHHYPIQ